MDASPLFDPQYLPVILATLIGFGALAALLLVPVYRFLEREEEVAERWTPDELAERIREARAAENDAKVEHAEEDLDADEADAEDSPTATAAESTDERPGGEGEPRPHRPSS